MGTGARECEFLDQPFEGKILVGEGVEDGVASAGDQGGGVWVAGEIEAYCEGIDKEADEVLDLGAAAAGCWRSDDDVGLPGEAAERGAISRRAARRRGSRLVRVRAWRGVGREPGRGAADNCLPFGFNIGRARPIGRQSEEFGGVGEAVAPMADLGREDAALLEPALPCSACKSG
jgi:hypothetical protein